MIQSRYIFRLSEIDRLQDQCSEWDRRTRKTLYEEGRGSIGILKAKPDEGLHIIGYLLNLVSRFYIALSI